MVENLEDMMREFRSYRFSEIRRSIVLAVRIGLLTAAIILLFQMVNLLVLYRYMKLDIYLCLVALFFLTVGFLLNRRRGGVRIRVRETGELVPSAGLGKMELLSAKECQILRLVAEGKTNKEIAASQFIELSTVKTHLNNIYSKLSVRNRKEARVRYAEFATKWPAIG